MKKMLLALITVLGLVITAIPGNCTTNPVANAVVLEPDFSFGTVAEGQKTTHTFILQNKGDAKLLIKRVETG